MATLITKNSSTASSVPTAAQLVQGELAVNVTDKRLFTENASGTVVELGTNPSSLTLPNGTANGVAYLNGSKVLTTGSALTFDGTNLGVGASPTFYGGQVATAGSIAITGGNLLKLWNTGGTGVGGISSPGTDTLAFGLGSGFTEQMRLTSTGLGIGTSSPGAKLGIDVAATSGYWERFYSSGTELAYWYFDANTLQLSSKSATRALTFLTNDTERARIDSSGNLLVGTTSGGITNSNSVTLERSSGAYVVVNHSGTVSGDKYAYFNYNGSNIGSITQNGTTGVLYNLTSDYRLKHNPVPVTGSGEFIDALKPKTWDWHDGSGKGVGFIAHEFMEVAKYSGNGEKDAVDAEGNPIYQSIQPSSSEVMAYLVAELQSLRKRVAELEAK